LFLNKSFTKGMNFQRQASNGSGRSHSVGKGMPGRSNSAHRSSHGSLHSSRSRAGNGDYYANVDRLRSVNKLTTLDNSFNNGTASSKYRGASPKVQLPA
jgi:hypothetical protein